MGRGSCRPLHQLFRSSRPGLIQNKFKVPVPRPPPGISSRRDWLEAKTGPPSHFLMEEKGCLRALQACSFRRGGQGPERSHWLKVTQIVPEPGPESRLSDPFLSQSTCFKSERVGCRLESQSWLGGVQGDRLVRKKRRQGSNPQYL